MKRDTRTAYRARAAATERSVDAAMAEIHAAYTATSEEWAAEYARRTAPIPFTMEDLKEARVIRTAVGWHKIVRVNQRSVTVETEYSWTDRYTLEKVLEVR